MMMKFKVVTLLLALSAAWSLQSCDNDDNDSISVPTELQNAFSSKYPNAANVKWETKSGYYVADFYDGYEASAWFTQTGEWQMTETDVPYKSLPQAVKISFEASEYASWKMDDVDKVDRQDFETVYVIEVEKQNQEIDLYYSAEGILIKSIVDTDNDNDHYLPTAQLTAEMKAFILTKYQGAQIVEIDIEDDNNASRGFTEVDIIHDNTSKEILFKKNGDWYSTSWDVNVIPNHIGIIISQKYAGYQIDDAEFFDIAEGTDYYLIELEKNNASDIKIKIAEDGTEL